MASIRASAPTSIRCVAKAGGVFVVLSRRGARSSRFVSHSLFLCVSGVGRRALRTRRCFHATFIPRCHALLAAFNRHANTQLPIPSSNLSSCPVEKAVVASWIAFFVLHSVDDQRREELELELTSKVLNLVRLKSGTIDKVTRGDGCYAFLGAFWSFNVVFQAFSLEWILLVYRFVVML